MKNFKKFSEKNLPDLRGIILQTIDEIEHVAQSDVQTSVRSKIRDVICDGKMLRGQFVLLGYEMYRSTQDKSENLINPLKLAAAIEFNHTGLLIHDDIIDYDTLRRGKDTMHIQFQKDGLKGDALDPVHYGVSMAIITGDVCLYTSYYLLSQSGANSVITSRLGTAYFHELFTTCIGELIDVDSSERVFEPTRSQIQTMHKWKTGRYTFSLPFKLGALAGGADDTEIKKFDAFGETLGLVFQLKDDELGLFGDPHVTGKSVSADIAYNKKTLMRYELFQRADAKDVQFLQKCFGNPNVTNKDLQLVKDMVVGYRIQKDIEDEMKMLSEEAQNYINDLAVDEKYRDILYEIVVYNTHRTS